MNTWVSETELERVTALVNAYRRRATPGRPGHGVDKTRAIRDLIARMPSLQVTHGLRLAAAKERSLLSPEEAELLKQIARMTKLTPATVAATIVCLEGGALP
jgi:hypothetical protein